jgi:NAD(P)-dependent dehydrogenase (short-subunit alcohol dehydrogenase family)
MNIEGSVALVTGANRGLGRAFTRLLLDQGAAKVYGGARDPGTITVDGVVPVPLDITSAGEIEAAGRTCGDVSLLINNAGINTFTSALAPDSLEAGRREMETNVFGTLAMSKAFAPVLAENGGGALANVLSILSWVSLPRSAMYGASKAALWSLTNSLRLELQPQGTLVVAVHVGPIDTDMGTAVEAPKVTPERVVEQTLDAIAHNRIEVLADEMTRRVRRALADDLACLYPTLAPS